MLWRIVDLELRDSYSTIPIRYPTVPFFVALVERLGTSVYKMATFVLLFFWWLSIFKVSPTKVSHHFHPF